MNDWITFFTEMTHLLSSSLVDVRFRQERSPETDSFRKITEALSGIQRRPDLCDFFLIRSKGLAENPMSEGPDGYELVTRGIEVNTTLTPKTIREAGSRLSSFSDKLSEAFDVFSANNIHSIYVNIPSRMPDDLERLRDSMRILSGFIQAVKTDSPVVFKRNGKNVSMTLVNDENGRPHPNLTIAMGLNNLDPKKMQGMVQKVDVMLKEPDSEKEAGQFIDVYDAMTCSPKFQQLLKPPIEINNVRWLLADNDTDTLSNEKIRVARLAMAFIEDSPHRVSQLLSSIYGNDVECISARVLAERLILITSFLNSIENKKLDEATLKEVLDSVVHWFPQVPRDIRNNMMLVDDKLHVTSSSIEIPVGMIHPEFVKMIRFFGGRPQPKEEVADIKTKNPEKDAAHHPDTDETPVAVSASDVVQLSEPPDTEHVSAAEKSAHQASDMEKLVGARIDQMERNGSASTEAAKKEGIDTRDHPRDLAADSNTGSDDMVTSFKQCFDTHGHFIRGSFEKHIPAFAKHSDQVFEFVWQYLKAARHRDERLALLNSLYSLVNKIDQSEEAVSVLLNDIFGVPDTVNIFDRNGLMLANLVIRKYNKEVNTEIELTPEEVFLVREGLIGSAVNVASGIIENNPKNIRQKQMAVYSGITTSLKTGETNGSMPFRYLLNLEREASIFLSLVGGPTPRAVLRDGLKMYGNPESDIYKVNGDYRHTIAFFQHLKILVRGLGRIGEKEDIPVLMGLRNNEPELMQYGHDPKSQDMVQRIMTWADEAVKHIDVMSQETITA